MLRGLHAIQRASKRARGVRSCTATGSAPARMSCDGQTRGAQEAVVWCTTCGNNVHEQCFGMWVSQRAKQGADAVCVFCRAMWPVSPPDNPKSAAKKPRARAVARPSTIVNLFDVSQVRPWPGRCWKALLH